MEAVLEDLLEQTIALPWPPMAHVRRGWSRLDAEGRAVVRERLARTVPRYQPPAAVNRAALRRFFSFLSQVEVIAIEVPLSALPTASGETKRLLERQLADEVFHSTVFAALAQKLGGLEPALPEAEALLDQIRAQPDKKTSAILLNLIAEGWIENLFDQAVTWGVANDVFGLVLDDESRHVEEAHHHAEGVDLTSVGAAVREFETGLFRLSQHPRVMLPILALVGEARFRALGASFLAAHKHALGEAGIEPAPAILEMERLMADMEAPEIPRPTEIEPETQWRRSALDLWEQPRSPAMSGWCEVRVDHVAKHLLTPVVIAALGKVYAEYPRVNRYAHGATVYQPTGVHVGVRAAVGEKGEALTTIVVPDADKRSVDDIRRLIRAGIDGMNELGARVDGLRPEESEEPLGSVLADRELMAMLPPGAIATAVTVSNVGKAGLYAGFGTLPGPLGQSMEIIVGRVEKRPQWTGWRYKPVDTVTIGFTADHRVIDGAHAGIAMQRFREALSRDGVAKILARPDTLTDADAAKAARAHGNAALLLSCKAPFWLGWLCHLFKK